VSDTHPIMTVLDGLRQAKAEAERWRKLAEELAEALDGVVVDKGSWTLNSGVRAHAEHLLACYQEAAK